MQKETARSFWRRFLALANRGENISVNNPGLDFTVSVRAGEHNCMPENRYDTVLHDHEQLSAIWQDRQQAAAGMRREIDGRINRIVSLRPLSVEDYRAILTGPVLDDLMFDDPEAAKFTILSTPGIPYAIHQAV